MEPKEHHRKTRLTKNEKMTIALAKVMARSTADLWVARAPALFFRLELADAIVYKITTAFLLILILLFYLSMLARELIDK